MQAVDICLKCDLAILAVKQMSMGPSIHIIEKSCGAFGSVCQMWLVKGGLLVFFYAATRPWSKILGQCLTEVMGGQRGVWNALARSPHSGCRR